jgi:Domain of unknown function (DUF4349)
MERSREYDDIAVALAEARPTPRPDFAAELDELVANGFQRDARKRQTPLAALADRLRALSPQRLLFATSGAALASIVVATVIVASVDSGATRETIDGGGEARFSKSQSFDGGEQSSEPPFLSMPNNRAGKPSSSSAGQELSASSASGAGSETQSSDKFHSSDRLELQRALGELRGRNASANLHPAGDSLSSFSSSLRHRDIERSAEITLLAEPADVAGDSAEVFRAVHDARGIVLRSTTASGRNAGARFELLIPSRNLGDALAAFSAIDEVGSRHEATTDITAPTVSVEDQLRDSRARIDGLLAQLAAVETESTRETVESELRRERRHAAALQAQLERLQRRTDYSRVSLRIETGASSSSSSGGWGIDDAVDDAGHILAIAAGVTIVGLAILGPLALIGLLAWLVYRLWLRRARDRALA